MPLVLNITWGDSWTRPKAGLARVIEDIKDAGKVLPKPTSPDDPAIEVYIYVSGSVWQHEREGFRLGSLTERGRNWLRVMIYVPDALTDEDGARTYFADTFATVAGAVCERLTKRRPSWPIEALTDEVRALTPSL